jgi:methylase of polypeptide subunit release factors
MELAKSFSIVVGTDLIRPEISDWKGSGANYLVTDAALCFRTGSFDLVAFNPPYVPSEGITDRAVDGGMEGAEVALHFLRDAMAVVKDDGKILMLASSDNPLRFLRSECESRGFTMRRVAEERLFFEKLSVYEISRGSTVRS